MTKCQCLGCLRAADRNVGGRFVCNPCYLKQGHLYFPHKKPFPTFQVLMAIIIVLLWLVADISVAGWFNLCFEFGRRYL